MPNEPLRPPAQRSRAPPAQAASSRLRQRRRARPLSTCRPAPSHHQQGEAPRPARRAATARYAPSARACLLTLAAEDDDGGEKDTAQVGAGVLVVPGRDAAPLL